MGPYPVACADRVSHTLFNVISFRPTLEKSPFALKILQKIWLNCIKWKMGIERLLFSSLYLLNYIVIQIH